MSDLGVTNSPESSITEPKPQRCCNSSILKISLFVFGLLLIGGAITSHIYQANPIAVYAMGGSGSALILISFTASVIQYISRRRSEARAKEEEQRKEELQQKANEEQSRLRKLAENGDVAELQEALKNNPLTDLTKLLHVAAVSGHAKAVSLLLEKGANPRFTSEYDNQGYSALHLAASCRGQKGLDTMRVLLEKDPTLASEKAEYKSITPLLLAVNGDDKEIDKQIVELLIKNGADVNVADSDRNTPLHEAASGFPFSKPNIEIIEILVREGAKWNAKNNKGETPFQIAQERHPKWYNDPEIQKRLSNLVKQ